jgi:hypothetical protein
MAARGHHPHRVAGGSRGGDFRPSRRLRQYLGRSFPAVGNKEKGQKIGDRSQQRLPGGADGGARPGVCSWRRPDPIRVLVRPRMSSLAEVVHEVAVPPRPARRAPWGPTTGLTEGSRRAGRSGRTQLALRHRPPEPGRHVHGLDGSGGRWRSASCVLVEGGRKGPLPASDGADCPPPCLNHSYV